MGEHSYEDVVPRHLRDIADELGLEEPAWYVGRPPVESLIGEERGENDGWKGHIVWLLFHAVGGNEHDGANHWSLCSGGVFATQAAADEGARRCVGGPHWVEERKVQ